MMKMHNSVLPALLLALLLCTRAFGAGPATPISVQEYDTLMNSISNWGRWGKHDQLGTLNLVTNKTRKAAAALVKTGEAVSLGLDLEELAIVSAREKRTTFLFTAAPLRIPGGTGSPLNPIAVF